MKVVQSIWYADNETLVFYREDDGPIECDRHEHDEIEPMEEWAR